MADEVTTDWRFVLVPEALVDSDLSDAAVRIYLVLATYADRARASFPSIATIGERAGNKARRTVQRAIDELVRAGAVRVEPRTARNGRQTSNLYRLLRMGDVTSDTRATSDTGEGATSDTVISLNKTQKEVSTRPARADDRTGEAHRITSAAYDRDKMINFPAVLKLVQRMLSVGGEPGPVEKAVMGVLDSGKPITTETLRLEYAKHKPRPRRNQAPWEVD